MCSCYTLRQQQQQKNTKPRKRKCQASGNWIGYSFVVEILRLFSIIFGYSPFYIVCICIRHTDSSTWQKPSLHSMRSVLVFLENLPRWLIWFFNVHVLLCAVAILLSLSLLIVHTERPTYEQHKKRHAFYPIKWLLRASTIAYKFIWKLFVWFHFHEVMKLKCTLRCVL